jgi:hypothetical protein
VRASARSTRIAERALLAGQRPVLVPAGLEDPVENVQFADGRVFLVGNGQALVRLWDPVTRLHEGVTQAIETRGR